MSLGSEKQLVERDLKHIWHPCSQMKDYETFQPLAVASANGAYLTLKDGREIIDAISSWWCKSLGHSHPRLKHALVSQMERFEHVIFANTTNETIVSLSETLANFTPNLDKVFYAGDGSCAVEVALKMSVHARVIMGQTERKSFMALSNGYHGETALTLSVSDVGLYKAPYQSMLHDCHFLQDIPYVSGRDDPLWHDCGSVWPSIEAQLEPHSALLTALIVEPILQGACGMMVYSQDFLKRLHTWCKKHDVHLVADEILTGCGRTGTKLACEHAGIEPDFVCLSKGLTSGWLPFSAVLTSSSIYDFFYDDYETGKAFLHSHTYTGNALAAAVSLECLAVLEEEGIYQYVDKQSHVMRQLFEKVAQKTQKIKNIRSIGGMVAGDLIVKDDKARVGYTIFQEAVKLGALLRPLGNVMYWLPPLNTDTQTLESLASITERAIAQVDF